MRTISEIVKCASGYLEICPRLPPSRRMYSRKRREASNSVLQVLTGLPLLAWQILQPTRMNCGGFMMIDSKLDCEIVKLHFQPFAFTVQTVFARPTLCAIFARLQSFAIREDRILQRACAPDNHACFCHVAKLNGCHVERYHVCSRLQAVFIYFVASIRDLETQVVPFSCSTYPRRIIMAANCSSFILNYITPRHHCKHYLFNLFACIRWPLW